MQQIEQEEHIFRFSEFSKLRTITVDFEAVIGDDWVLYPDHCCDYHGYHEHMNDVFEVNYDLYVRERRKRDLDDAKYEAKTTLKKKLEELNPNVTIIIDIGYFNG